MLGKQMAIHVGAQDRGRAQDRRAASRSASAPRRARRRRSPPRCCWSRSAAGPVTDGLNLESTKVAARPRLRQDQPPDGDGRARASSRSATWWRSPDRPHPQLAHVASSEGIGVAERLAGHARRAAQLRPRPLGHLLPARDGRRRPHRGRGEEARLRRAGRPLQLRQPRQAAHPRPPRGAGEGRLRGEVRRGAGRPHGRART